MEIFCISGSMFKKLDGYFRLLLLWMHYLRLYSDHTETTQNSHIYEK